MMHSGDTSTTQMSQKQLVIRFLTRTREEVNQLRACLPAEPLALEPQVLSHITRIAHKIASAAESFGYPEVTVIAGAIELLAHDAGPRSARDRMALAMRLEDKAAALEIYVEHALAEAEKHEEPPKLPLSAQIPRLGLRRK